ncbi:MAG: bifunctional sulfate adenylyltransferase/adenylylsulfate kinase [Thermoleophilaceae bacterium]|nr:bifunctional sulfate adenylyltransferase/adenylylsulfate kinase [Thermoleophilaceae bacterium]
MLAQTPYGGELVDLVVGHERAAELHEESRDWQSWSLTPKQLADLELLLCGAFSPLRGFMAQADYESVRDTMRLTDGTLWPIPITLGLPKEMTQALSSGDRVALRDPEGVMLAAVCVQDVWAPDRDLEAERVWGTTDPRHPGVRQLMEGSGRHFLAGGLEGLAKPTHHDFTGLRLSPTEVRAEIERRGWERVVALSTRNAMHRAQQELTLRVASELGAGVLLHPVVGPLRTGDVDHFTRIRTLQALLARYPTDAAMLALLGLAMRAAGPREALFHAIIRRNFGATHLFVSENYAGPGEDAGGPFHGPDEAKDALREHEEEVGVTMVPFETLVWAPERGGFVSEDELEESEAVLSISDSELQERLEFGRELPEWFTPPEVARELRRARPPRSRQGFTVFMTGLSGSGKSTVANALMARLLELGDRNATLLDGDVVRHHLSSELGFSREHREINVRRIGWVASEITKNGGVAVCAPIAPYHAVRDDVRRMIEPAGGYMLVHVSTPLDVCEGRDRKGLYAKARAGVLEQFTGISDPYEEPNDAEVTIDTTRVNAAEGAQAILDHLIAEGYIVQD